jgi:transcriptional regulator with XRE-family HTH domain
MSVAENVKRCREAKDLTQAELAQLVGVGQSFVAQIERGSKVPNLLLGKELAAALGVTVEELLK